MSFLTLDRSVQRTCRACRRSPLTLRLGVATPASVVSLPLAGKESPSSASALELCPGRPAFVRHRKRMMVLASTQPGYSSTAFLTPPRPPAPRPARANAYGVGTGQALRTRHVTHIILERDNWRQLSVAAATALLNSDMGAPTRSLPSERFSALVILFPSSRGIHFSVRRSISPIRNASVSRLHLPACIESGESRA